MTAAPEPDQLERDRPQHGRPQLDQALLDLPQRPRRGRSFGVRWRPLLRGLHRDFGYFVVGLTFVYALSGLAVNHIADWDPNFRQIERSHTLRTPISLSASSSPEGSELDTNADDTALAQRVLAELGRSEEAPQEVYRASPTRLDVVLEHSTLHLDDGSDVVLEEGQKARWLLRIANWLHLNRGKRAWTYIADAYAVILLFLATSGLFMLPARGRGIGRRGVLLTVGVLVPVVYVALSGGP